VAFDLEIQQVSIGDLALVVGQDLNAGGNHIPKDMLLAAGRAISQIGSSTAQVAVPKQVANAIARGELVRHGGVVRDGTGKLRVLLKDPSTLTTIAKSPVWALIALDLAQSALLNAKLAEIQNELRVVHAKVDALLHSKLRAAFEDAAQLQDILSIEHRSSRIHSALDRISEALPAAEKLLSDSLLEASKAASKVSVGGSFWESDSHCFDEFETRCKQVMSSTIVAASLLALRARLFDELDEQTAAGNTHRRLTALILSVDGRLTPMVDRVKAILRGKMQQAAPSVPIPLGGLKTIAANILLDYQNEITRSHSRESSTRVDLIRATLSQSSAETLAAHSTLRVLST
jgi:hypothetical protein